ncbi:MAG: hypothetical protein IJ774_06620 [Selenomonadaceae bacterium]|nr:hypothetical protein [Selenomonadaceae bacterium]
MGKLFNQLNFFAGVSVIATTALTVLFFYKYSQSKLPPAAENESQATDKLSDYWYLGLFGAELVGQIMASKSLDATDAVLSIVFNVAVNIVVFFVCYKVLGVAGIDKENLYARCKKAFMGLVILSISLMLLADYALDMQPASNQNVPAVNQQVQAEYVTTLNGENIYLDRDSLIRTNNVNEDAAPEFKCVLVGEDGTRQSCEFKARGIVVVYIDGIKVADSVENPDIEKLYSAIVKKFL